MEVRQAVVDKGSIKRYHYLHSPRHPDSDPVRVCVSAAVITEFRPEVVLPMEKLRETRYSLGTHRRTATCAPSTVPQTPTHLVLIPPCPGPDHTARRPSCWGSIRPGARLVATGPRPPGSGPGRGVHLPAPGAWVFSSGCRPGATGPAPHFRSPWPSSAVPWPIAGAIFGNARLRHQVSCDACVVHSSPSCIQRRRSGACAERRVS